MKKANNMKMCFLSPDWFNDLNDFKQKISKLPANFRGEVAEIIRK